MSACGGFYLLETHSLGAAGENLPRIPSETLLHTAYRPLFDSDLFTLISLIDLVLAKIPLIDLFSPDTPPPPTPPPSDPG